MGKTRGGAPTHKADGADKVVVGRDGTKNSKGGRTNDARIHLHIPRPLWP